MTISIYVISLDTETGRARLDRLGRHLTKLGLSFHVQPGVHGKYLTPDKVAAMATPICGALCTPAMLGCGASHVAVWRRLIASGAPYAMVLEDDTELVPDIRDHLEVVVTSMRPDTDMVLLGCFVCGTSPRSVPASQQSLVPKSRFAGTHAYIVTQRGAKRLLQLVDPVPYHIDTTISWHAIRGRLHIEAVAHDVATQSGGEATSANVGDRPPGFPGTVYTALQHVHDPKGQSLFFYAGMPAFRLGGYRHHMAITGLDLLLLVLVAAGVATPLQIAAFVVLDMAFTREYSVSRSHVVAKAAVMVAIGTAIRAAIP